MSNPTSVSRQDYGSVFEERAEHFSLEELRRWSAPLPHDEKVIRKLKGRGTKLLCGPRGSGKSTLLRLAYFEMLEKRKVLPVYVNYAKSLSLEPLFHTNANAISIFRQWLISKIICGVGDVYSELSRSKSPSLSVRCDIANEVVSCVNSGATPPDSFKPISVTELVNFLKEWTRDCDRSRCVLLLDDAAHAFSSEQQQEFFEMFRFLKSPVVSAKAAVYPGVTHYSPNFHIGHEAEKIDVWINPDDPNYLNSMRSLFKKRIPNEMASGIQNRSRLIDFLAMASFGIPRAFLNMVSRLLDVDGDSHGSMPSTSDARDAVSIQAESVRSVFSSLSAKLPRFRHFVELGLELQTSVSEVLRAYNYHKTTTQKAVILGISEPLDNEMEVILGLMEYAGLIRSIGSVHQGSRGRYMRYLLHYAVVISDNILNMGQTSAVAKILHALRHRDAHCIAYSRATALLGDNYKERCKLNLEPCTNCGEPRGHERAKFCMKCGHQLIDSSIYEELLATSIKYLPLTDNKIKGLLKHTKIRTVQDILLDKESRQILSVPFIGPVWSKRIHNAAEEFVSV